ncbi:MAG: transglycosylase SLT domain-containing protein [Deltaproteobacteria bacterium]|nr:transglycosylase SLT domain-containing protein [Deltaproteobacteria bacterium]
MRELAKQGGLALLLLTSSARAEGPAPWMLSPSRARLLLLDAVLSLERTIQAADRALRRLTLAEQLNPLGDSPAGPPGSTLAPPGSAPRRTGPEAFRETQHGPFDDLILAAALRFEIDPFLLKGLIANESKLEPVGSGKRQYAQHAEGRVLVAGGAIGIAQFTGGGIRAVNSLRGIRARRSRTVPLRFDGEQARVPCQAIPAAAEFLSFLVRRYGRDGGITAYNTGLGGGYAVRRMGFWKARRAGMLDRRGIYLLQGHRFLLNVLRRTNQYRVRAGLSPLPLPVDTELPRSRAPRVAQRELGPSSLRTIPFTARLLQHRHALAEESL